MAQVFEMECGSKVILSQRTATIRTKGTPPTKVMRSSLTVNAMEAAASFHDAHCPTCKALKVTRTSKTGILQRTGTSALDMSSAIEDYTTPVPVRPEPAKQPSRQAIAQIQAEADAHAIADARAVSAIIMRAMGAQWQPRRQPNGTWNLTGNGVTAAVTLPNSCTCAQAEPAGCAHVWATRLHVASIRADQLDRWQPGDKRPRAYRRARQAFTRARSQQDWLAVPDLIGDLVKTITAIWPEKPLRPEVPTLETEPVGDQDQEPDNGCDRMGVVNIHHEKYNVYIGRGSPWGNPYSIGRDGTRHEVLRKYAQMILENPRFIEKVSTLRGQVLGCYCAPAPCHGDLLAELADAPPQEHGAIIERWAELPDPPKKTRNQLREKKNGGGAEQLPLPLPSAEGESILGIPSEIHYEELPTEDDCREMPTTPVKELDLDRELSPAWKLWDR